MQGPSPEHSVAGAGFVGRHGLLWWSLLLWWGRRPVFALKSFGLFKLVAATLKPELPASRKRSELTKRAISPPM